MSASIPEKTALKLDEIFSEYGNDFDLSSSEGRQSLKEHLINKFKSGNLTINDGLILGFFNEGFSQKSAEIKFNKSSFIDSNEKENFKNKIQSYLKIGEDGANPTSSVTVMENYTNLKNKLVDMGESMQSPLSVIGAGDFTEKLPQTGRYRTGSVNAISLIARAVSSNLESMFIDPSDRNNFLNKFTWVEEIRSSRWNDRIRLAGKSKQDWLGTNVKSGPISEAVNHSLHFQTLHKGLSVVKDPDVKNFLYLKSFLHMRAVQFKDLVYGSEQGTVPYYDPELKMIIFEPNVDVRDPETGIKGSLSYGKKHYFNFKVSDHIHDFFTRIHKKNVENGLSGENKLNAVFPTLHGTGSDNKKIIDEIRRPGGLFDLTNTPVYRQLWQRGGINDVADLRKWVYSFYETHYASRDRAHAKANDLGMGHKVSQKEVGSRYGGKGAIKDTWHMTELKDLLTRYEQSMLDAFKDTYRDQIPNNIRITTGDLPSIFLVNFDLQNSPAPVLFNRDTFEVDTSNFRSSNVGVVSYGSVAEESVNNAVLLSRIESELRANSLQQKNILNELVPLSRQMNISTEELYNQILSKIPENELNQNDIVPTFQRLIYNTQIAVSSDNFKASSVTAQINQEQAAAPAREPVPSPRQAVTPSEKPPEIQQQFETLTSEEKAQQKIRMRTLRKAARNALRNSTTPGGIKKAITFGAGLLSPYAFLEGYAAEAAIIEAYEKGRDVLDPELSEVKEDLGGLERIDPTKYDSPYFETVEEEALLGVDDDPDFRQGISSEGRFDELEELRRMGLPLQEYAFTDQPRSLEQYRGHMGDIPRISDETYDAEREELATQITGIEGFGPKLQDIRGDEDRFLAEMQRGELSPVEERYAGHIIDKYKRRQRMGKEITTEDQELDPVSLEQEQINKARRALGETPDFNKRQDPTIEQQLLMNLQNNFST